MPATTAAADSSTVITGRRMNDSETFIGSRPSRGLPALALASLPGVVLHGIVLHSLGGRAQVVALRFGDGAAGPQVLRALHDHPRSGGEAAHDREALLHVGELDHLLLDLAVVAHHVDEARVGTGLHGLRR